MDTETSVWDRRSATGAEVTPFVYNGIIGAVLAWGFFLNAVLTLPLHKASAPGSDPSL